jgi:hypothetical protein
MSYIVHDHATIICPHLGSVSTSTSNNRVFVNNRPVVTQVDSFRVRGCKNGNNPCIRAIWTGPAQHVFANGKPIILQSSRGYCIPTNGPPNVIHTQYRVSGK